MGSPTSEKGAEISIHAIRKTKKLQKRESMIGTRTEDGGEASQHQERRE
jgi:hypothetical protein